MNFCFPPFWHCVRNLSKCNKLVTITLFGIYLVNKTIKYDEQRWICLRTVDFYITDAWKSIFRGKSENIQKVYSIGLWICLPWEFCASSWDHEIFLKTVRLERSVLGWGEGCPMLWQINPWHCIVSSKFVHFPFWRVVHVPFPGWYLSILQFHLALGCLFKAMLLKNV